MPTTKQRGSLVIYVAGSARELPAEVQDWLGRAENRAVASPHIYDMLAQLAQGKKFAAIIVNIQSVDWNELDFFAQAARLSRGTPIYVAGPYAQRAKIEAACRHGARLFDPVGLTEAANANTAELSEWDRPVPQSAPTAKMATPVPTVVPVPATSPTPTVSPIPSEPKTTSFAGGLKLWLTSEQAKTIIGEGNGNGRLSNVLPAVEATKADTRAPMETPVAAEVAADLEIQAEPEIETAEEPVCIPDSCSIEDSSEPSVQADAETDMDVAALEIELPTDDISSDLSSEPALSTDNQPEPWSAFRLAPVEDESEPRITFPWSPHPDRPRRTPPRAVEPNVPSPAREVGSASQSASAGSSMHVRLTQEEIAALMGDPPRSEQAREAADDR